MTKLRTPYMLAYGNLTDVTDIVKVNNIDLNSTDRVFDTPGGTRVKVRMLKTKPHRQTEIAIGYDISISLTDDNGKAHTRDGLTESAAREALAIPNAKVTDLFQVSLTHVVTLNTGGELEVQETIEAIITQQIDRHVNDEAHKVEIEAYMSQWESD